MINNSRKHRYRKRNARKIFTWLSCIVIITVSLVIWVPTLFNKRPPTVIELPVDNNQTNAKEPISTPEFSAITEDALPEEDLEPPINSDQSKAEYPVATPESSTITEDVLQEENFESEDHCAPEETSDSGEIADAVSSATKSAQNVSQLALGDHGSSVSKLQVRLAELFYFDNEVTDYYGTLTESAVRLFQHQNGLEDDGIAGIKTLELLYSEDAKPNQT